MATESRIVLTGATGFVGSAVLRRCLSENIVVCAVVRAEARFMPPGITPIFIDNLSPDTDWSHIVRESDVVIHSAARVHVMNETEADPLSAFRRTNVDATLNFARQCAAAGVRRFIFL